MKRLQRLFILFTLLSLLLSACKKGGAGTEETPDWKVFRKYYVEKD